MGARRRAPAKLQLRLYVALGAPNSVRAINNLHAILNAHFAGRHEVEVVDLLAFPKRAMADGIIVTPTLLRLRPLPPKRLIGDLGDASQVLMTLSSR